MEHVKGSPKAQGERGKRIPGSKNTSGKKGNVSAKLLLVGFIIGTALFALIFKACFTLSPEEKIRRLIQKASKVVEKRHLSKSLSYLSIHYQDDHGFDYQTLSYLVAQTFRAYPILSVSSTIHSIVVQENRAEVDLQASVFGTAPSQPPEDLLAWRGSNRFLVTFKKEKKEWKVVATKKPEDPDSL